MESEKSEVDERVMAVQMLSNLCNIKLKVQGLTDKMRTLVDMTNSGMSSVEQINQFLNQLEQFQCLVIKDLNKTGEVARCQYKVINDIEAFMDTLKNRQRRLKNICLDLQEGQGDDKTLKSPCVCNENSTSNPEQFQQQNGKVIDQQVKHQSENFCSPQFPVMNQDSHEPYNDIRTVNNYEQENDTSKENELFISDIHPLGKYIKITNPCNDKVQDLGGYALCQIVEGCDFGQFSIFRFPLRIGLPSGESLKVWSNCYDPGLCRNARDLVAAEVSRWSTTPEVVTKLCDCTDQTISWIKGCRLCMVPGF